LKILLSDTIKYFYSDDVIKATNEAVELTDKESAYRGTSDEYLFEAFQKPLKDYGYPRSVHGIPLTRMEYKTHSHYDFQPLHQSSMRIGKHLGVERAALIMSYPDNGYIGWHHNGNAPGHNVLFSYSQDGDGGFYYWDYELKKIIEMKDEPGWNVKVGYYPSEKKEPERVYWHMAKTKKHRVSIAFVIDHTTMWKNMIEEITNGEYDPSIIKR
jgi:hypothetical protein